MRLAYPPPVPQKELEAEARQRKQIQNECEAAKQLAAEKSEVVKELLADAAQAGHMRDKSTAFAREVLAHYNEVV